MPWAPIGFWSGTLSTIGEGLGLAEGGLLGDLLEGLSWDLLRRCLQDCVGLPLVFGDDWGGFLKGFPGGRRLPERISWWPPGTSALLGPLGTLLTRFLAGLGFFCPVFANYDAYTGLTRPIGLCLGLPLVFWVQKSPDMVRE